MKVPFIYASSGITLIAPLAITLPKDNTDGMEEAFYDHGSFSPLYINNSKILSKFTPNGDSNYHF